MPDPFNHPDEAMEALEAGVNQAANMVKKSAGQTAKNVKDQADFSRALYAPSEPSVEQDPKAGAQQQAGQHKIDPTMQATNQENSQLDETRRQLRDLQRQHNQTYIRGPLDTSPTLEQEVAKERQTREQAEKNREQEEAEIEQQKKDQVAQEMQELPQPGSKPKPGSPAVDQAKTKTEIHRGTSG